MDSSFGVTVVVQTRDTQLVGTQLSSAMNRRFPQVDAAARGWVEMAFLVEARSLADACAKAINMTRSISGANPISCSVIDHDEVAGENAPSLFSGRHVS